MATSNSVKVINGALDETPKGEVILRGVLTTDSLWIPEVDDYQREVLAQRKVDSLKEAIMGAGVPDIELGMRGQHCIDRDGVYFLSDPIFIIDGYQRVTAARQLLEKNPEILLHLGATIHFGTTEEMERDLFEALNLGQTRLSPNVTLRNQRKKIQAADALYRLSNVRGFPLYNKISWNQSMKRGELVTATTFVKVTGMLHSHAGPGRSSVVLDLIWGVQTIMDNVGRAVMIQNVKTFFELIDGCWGIQRVAYRQSAPYIRSTFMLTLARVLSDHETFWKGDKLVVEPSLGRKLASFPINDPEVIRLASASGMAAELLYSIMVNHINSGKRTKRLVQRRSLRDKFADNHIGVNGGNHGDDAGELSDGS
ncbi:MAG TPA: hypothetical protein VMQ52_04070 [Candidatus Saccharimonadales bacterium]|jgi:hypothetical protein|nr:hypothetical protein [Candidatus Saccharimonadales bacterium]